MFAKSPFKIIGHANVNLIQYLVIQRINSDHLLFGNLPVGRQDWSYTI